MKKILTITLALFLFFSPFFMQTAGAQLVSNGEEMTSNADQVGQTAGFSSITIGMVIAGVIRASLGLLALIFVILTIVSGFRWMTAGGNEEQIKSARETLKTAIIGLIIVLAAYSITYFIFKYLPFSGWGGGMTNPL